MSSITIWTDPRPAQSKPRKVKIPNFDRADEILAKRRAIDQAKLEGRRK